MSFASLLARADSAVLAHLGEEDGLVYAPGSGQAKAVPGLFDAQYTLVEAGEAGVASVGPAAFVRLADLPTDPRADKAARLTVKGGTYKIRDVKPDGTGTAILVLGRA